MISIACCERTWNLWNADKNTLEERRLKCWNFWCFFLIFSLLWSFVQNSNTGGNCLYRLVWLVKFVSSLNQSWWKKARYRSFSFRGKSFLLTCVCMCVFGQPNTFSFFSFHSFHWNGWCDCFTTYNTIERNRFISKVSMFSVHWQNAYHITRDMRWIMHSW